jgi:hypothetical protein
MATPTLAVGFIIVALMVAPPRECPGARCRQAPGPTTTGAMQARSTPIMARHDDKPKRAPPQRCWH